MNSHLYYERPSRDGTLPDDDFMTEMGEILSETSSDEDSNKEEEETKKPEEKKVKMSQLTPEEQEKLRQKEAERKKNPLPTLPDVNKFDKVYILPFFCKPGKHNYMIKYKDTSEPRQAHLLKKIRKQEKRYRRGKNDANQGKPFDKAKYREAKKQLAAECFFYACDVPKRQEEIPACKYITLINMVADICIIL